MRNFYQQDLAAMRQDWCSACVYYDVCPVLTPLTPDCQELRDRVPTMTSLTGAGDGELPGNNY